MKATYGPRCRLEIYRASASHVHIQQSLRVGGVICLFWPLWIVSVYTKADTEGSDVKGEDPGALARGLRVTYCTHFGVGR